MRTLRQVINAARAGKRISGEEKKFLGEQLHVWWREKCARCRRTSEVDQLDANGGHCEECVEALAAGVAA